MSSHASPIWGRPEPAGQAAPVAWRGTEAYVDAIAALVTARQAGRLTRADAEQQLILQRRAACGRPGAPGLAVALERLRLRAVDELALAALLIAELRPGTFSSAAGVPLAVWGALVDAASPLAEAAALLQGPLAGRALLASSDGPSSERLMRAHPRVLAAALGSPPPSIGLARAESLRAADEDDADDRELAAAALAQAGPIVLEAADPMDAARLLDSIAPMWALFAAALDGDWAGLARDAALAGAGLALLAEHEEALAGLEELGRAGVPAVGLLPLGALRSGRFVRVTLRGPGQLARRRTWKRLFADDADQAQIFADSVASWPRAVEQADLAGRLQAAAGRRAFAALLDHAPLGRRLWLGDSFDSIVLPDESGYRLVEIVDRGRNLASGTPASENAAGLLAHFAGPAGTGKTMSAGVIARALGLEAVETHAAALMNLAHESAVAALLSRVAAGRTLLVVDESERLTNDGSGRPSPLLSRLGRSGGVVILCSREPGAVEATLSAAAAVAVRFPVPDEPSRLALWRQQLADSTGQEPLPVEALARHKWSGGQIRQAVERARALATAEGEALSLRWIRVVLERSYGAKGLP